MTFKLINVHWSRHAQAACPQVATSLRCRDTKAARIMSRHQIGVTTPPRPHHVATPPRQLHVATSNRCRDIVSPDQPKPGRDLPGDEPMSRHQFHVAISFLPIVGFPGRETKIPGRDLPHSRPCCDIKSMSRRRFFPTKAD